MDQAVTHAKAALEECIELRKVNADLLAALRFYADSRRYEGGNQKPLDDDPHQPTWLYYRLDVTRDNGHIAAAAIAKAKTDLLGN